MSCHIVIGKGNLGQDLELVLRASGQKVVTFARSGGDITFDYGNPISPQVVLAMNQLKPSDIWCTVGAGSVEDAKRDYVKMLDAHVRLPMHLVRDIVPQARLHFFSTDYLSEPGVAPRSLYAESKRAMENALIYSMRKGVRIYRVGSLYGTHRPWQTFPWKLLRNMAQNQFIQLPENKVTPTPTAWLAREVALYATVCPMNAPEVHSVAPRGRVKVCEWGHMISPGQRITSRGLDPERPYETFNSFTIGPHERQVPWWHLWAEHGTKLVQALTSSGMDP